MSPEPHRPGVLLITAIQRGPVHCTHFTSRIQGKRIWGLFWIPKSITVASLDILIMYQKKKGGIITEHPFVSFFKTPTEASKC